MIPPTPARLPCRHCNKRPFNRPRRLCWPCYYTPGLKELYPSSSKYARRGLGNISGDLPLPASPTTAVPGTAEKISVMCERAASGTAVNHPADARWEGDARPLEFLKRKVG